ncbi:MAG: nucleotidyltransferase domain-containing protein [Janthinobacterium lividum]
MIEPFQIISVANKIARQFQPERIILFGSYAYGTPNEDSDLDLLVVMPLPNKGRGRASDIRLHLDIAFPLDLVVCDPDYITQRIAMNDFFLREITEKGRILYAGDYAAVGQQS